MNGTDFWKAFAVPFGLLILFVIAFFAIYRIDKNFAKSPTIDLISGSEIVTDQTEVPITGVVKNTSKLKINDKDVSVSKDGSFSTVVPVEAGENKVEIAAGDKTQTKTTVKVVKEEAQKAVAATTPAATTTTGTNTNLSNSGPVETVMGSIGLAAIILSLMIFHKSNSRNSLQRA